MDFDLEVDLDETLDGLIPSREEADDYEERAAAERLGAVDIQESSDPLGERRTPMARLRATASTLVAR